MDKLSFEGVSEGRRRNMQSNRSKNPKPELLVRRALHKLGYRFSLHRGDLPGCPDIVFPSRRAVVEVRGCFWHGHGCALGQMPKSRREYWSPKLKATHERDAGNKNALESASWHVYEIWECEVRAGLDSILGQLISFLGPPKSQSSATSQEFLEQSRGGQPRDKGDQRP